MESKTVVVAEDDPLLRDLLAIALRRHGSDVAVLPNGRAALDHIERAAPPPDAVVTDRNMPELDGVDVCRRIRGRSEPDGVAVLVFTATAPGDLRLAELVTLPGVAVQQEPARFASLGGVLESLVAEVREQQAGRDAG